MTPGIPFPKFVELICSPQSVVDYFNTGKLKERLRQCQVFHNFPTGIPEYTRDTWVLVHSQLDVYIPIPLLDPSKIALVHQDSGMEDHVFFFIWSELTIEYWGSISEMGDAIAYFVKHATCKIQTLGAIASFAMFLRKKNSEISCFGWFQSFQLCRTS